MPLRISRLPSDSLLYEADESDRGTGETMWKTDRPMSLEELVHILEARGWHQTDIGDALYAVDPKLVGLRGMALT